MASVLVVIVNYRTARLVVDCLRSLEGEVAASGARVVVVDNDSGDDSCHIIASAIEGWGWSSWASLHASPVNGGFAYGNNLAVRAALQSAEPPDLVWLLNPDTCVHPAALGALVEFMRANPAAGIAGSGIDDEDGQPWPYAFRFPSLLGEVERGLRNGLVSRLLSRWVVLRRMGEGPARVDWLPGASMIVRRKVFEDVGLMDEGYFLYFEETDFCLQARRAGWQCWYVPQARVIHIAGQSTGVTGRGAAARRVPGYWFEARRRYFVRNHGRGYAATADLLWMAAHMLWRLRRWMGRRPDLDPPGLLSDFLRGSALVNSGLPGNSRLAPAAPVRPQLQS